MEVPEPRYATTADGTHIAYTVMGDGPIDLVYAFGYLSNIDADGEVRFHAAFRQRLASFFRLIVFDRRGLVLWGTYPRGKRSADYPWGWTDEEWTSRLEEIERSWGSMAFAEGELRSAAPGVSFDRIEIEKAARMFRATASPGSALAISRTLRDFDVRAVLPVIQVPTLVMHAANGPSIEESRYTASLIPGAALVEIPGTEYLPFWSSADRVTEEIRRFATSVRDEEAELSRVLATVLFTDIVGSTTKAVDLGDRAWTDLIERHHAVIRAMIRRYRGVEIDTAGDGFFATFDGPARGVKCAQAISEAVRPLGLEVRAGLHAGEVQTIDGKIGGIAVHIGARVGALAEPSEVLVSRTVKDLVVGSGLSFEDAGEHELKGVPDRWQLYRLVSGA